MAHQYVTVEDGGGYLVRDGISGVLVLLLISGTLVLPLNHRRRRHIFPTKINLLQSFGVIVSHALIVRIGRTASATTSTPNGTPNINNTGRRRDHCYPSGTAEDGNTSTYGVCHCHFFTCRFDG